MNLKVIGNQKIGNYAFLGIEGGFGENKKAMTVKDIAGIHSKQIKHINEAIIKNKKRFKQGIDIIDILGVDQIDPKKFGYSQQAVNAYTGLKNRGQEAGIYILSERGYFKLLKILEDDTAWEIYDQLIDGYFNMRETIKSNNALNQPDDLEIKRINAEARLKNANSRQAKLLSELAKTTISDVNKVLLEDKAVEVLTGKKMLEMPTMKEKLYDCNEIAKKLGILSKNGKPHETAVSQAISLNIEVSDNEAEIFPATTKNWGGTVTKYTQSVIDRLEHWLEDNNYPSVIQGMSKKYHVSYKHKNIA